jgi:hypothetical protein
MKDRYFKGLLGRGWLGQMGHSTRVYLGHHLNILHFNHLGDTLHVPCHAIVSCYIDDTLGQLRQGMGLENHMVFFTSLFL